MRFITAGKVRDFLAVGLSLATLMIVLVHSFPASGASIGPQNPSCESDDLRLDLIVEIIPEAGGGESSPSDAVDSFLVNTYPGFRSLEKVILEESADRVIFALDRGSTRVVVAETEMLNSGWYLTALTTCNKAAKNAVRPGS